MLKKAQQTKFHIAFLFVIGLVLLGNVFAVKELDFFDVPLFFAMALLVEFLLVILFIYEFIQILQTPLKIILSLCIAAWNGVQQNHYFLKAKKKYPALYRWISERFSIKKPTGLIMTIGIIIAVFFLSLLLSISEDIWFKELFVSFDQRILNLVPKIRTGEQTSFFSFVTFMANWQSVLFASFITLVILLYKKQNFAVILYTSGLIAAEGSVYILKHLVGRTRPDQALSLISEDSFSFPSGHTVAGTVIFGFLAYLIIKSTRRSLAKLFIFFGSIFAVVFIALSRIYLGVHYPSDVLASITLGCFLLSILIIISEINEKFNLFKQGKMKSLKELWIVPVLLMLFSLFLNAHFIKIREIKIDSHPKILSTIDDSTIKQLPNYSETLIGGRMEPVSFIYIGNQQQIENLFEKHGWYKADPSTISNTLKAIMIGLRNEQYFTGPVTPLYLNAMPNDLAFEQPIDDGTFRQRHHTRLWKIDYILPDGREIWMATASFDKGVKLSAHYLPTHAIDANIDAERSFIIKSLGAVNVKYIQVVEPQLGKNAAGDGFFTDGRAAIIGIDDYTLIPLNK